MMTDSCHGVPYIDVAANANGRVKEIELSVHEDNNTYIEEDDRSCQKQNKSPKISLKIAKNVDCT